MKIMVVFILALGVTCGVLGWQLKQSIARAGALEQRNAELVSTIEGNEKIRKMQLDLKDVEIAALKKAAATTQVAINDSLSREARLRSSLATVQTKLTEAISHDEKAVAWADLLVPDSVVDGMHAIAEDSINQVDEHRDDALLPGSNSGDLITDLRGRAFDATWLYLWGYGCGEYAPLRLAS